MRPRESSTSTAPEMPPFLQPHAEGVLVHLKVQPRASRDAVEGVMGGELKVRVTAPPVDSAANEAVVKLLAEWLDCPKSAVALLRGQTGRHKVALVRGRTAREVWARVKASA